MGSRDCLDAEKREVIDAAELEVIIDGGVALLSNVAQVLEDALAVV